MSVYYKFNSELNFSHVGFDGLHISVADLKKAILHQKRLGKSDFDLLVNISIFQHFFHISDPATNHKHYTQSNKNRFLMPKQKRNMLKRTA